MIRRKGKRSFSILGAWLKVFIDNDDGGNDNDGNDNDGKADDGNGGDNSGSLSPKK